MSLFLDKMAGGPRKILVTGHFGSGKTEFSVSLSFALSKLMRDTRCSAGIGAAAASGSITLKESKLALADLDIENPYFRSRERQDDLRAAGVSVYSDPFGGRNGSELQTIDARILAPIEDEDTRIIIDTGGDRSGAMILNQFSRHFHDDYQLLSVVNCNRPGTDTVEKAAEQIKAAEEATGLKFTGLISNAHFIRFTTPEDVIAGYEFTKQVGEVTGLPVLCACAMESVVAELEAMKSRSDAAIDPCMEVFPIGMYMRDTYLDKQV